LEKLEVSDELIRCFLATFTGADIHNSRWAPGWYMNGAKRAEEEDPENYEDNKLMHERGRDFMLNRIKEYDEKHKNDF
jgi:hypothetical protein